MKQLLEKGLRCDCVSVADCIVYGGNLPVQIGMGVRNGSQFACSR